MAVDNQSPVFRKLGEYIDCPIEDIESVLNRQSPVNSSDMRIGQALVNAKFISAEDLFRSIVEQRLDRLQACSLFSQLDRDNLGGLPEYFEEVSVRAGEQFITQHRPEPFLYILASGLLEVFVTRPDGSEVIITQISPGEPVGEMGYFSEGLRLASARALEDSQLLRAHYDRLSECFAQSPVLAHAFMEVATERLRRTNLLYQENQYRLKSAQSSLHHLNEFLDLSEAAELGAGIEGLIDRMVHTASSITDSDRASLFLIDPVNGELWSKVAEGTGVVEIRVAAGAGIIGWVAEHGKILNIPEAYMDLRFNREVDLKTGYRTRTILCAPIWSLKGEILGVVQVINKRIGLFGGDDESLLRAFAHQAAVAVENFELYRKMMVNHRRVSIMLDISTAIGRTLDLPTLIREIVDKTTEALQCDRSSFFVLDHETRELWSMEARGVELEEIRLPMSAGLAGSVATNGETINIPDAYLDNRFNPEFDKISGYRTRSVLCMPVLNRDGVVTGVTQAINKLGGNFDEEDVDLLRAISAQIGVALENAKLHASAVSMKNYLESVQQSISNCILTTDKNFQFVTSNKAARKLFPEVAGDRPDRDIPTIFGKRNRHLVELLNRVYESRVGVAEYDVDLHLASGGTGSVNVNIVPLTDTDEQFQGLVAVFEDITSEKRVKSAFSHYLAPAVIEQLLADPEGFRLGGEKRELTLIFTDIANFTSLSEQFEPVVVSRLLNEYFDLTGEVVLEHGGTIDKMVGDALHIMFNAPIDQPDHAECAVRCALDLHRACEKFRVEKNRQGIDLGHTRIGVNTGSAVVGNFGGTARFDYTAYGDSVNTAARLEGANKYLGTLICVAGSTVEKCTGIDFRSVGHLVLKGKTEAISVFEPQFEAVAASPKQSQYLQAFELLDRDDPAARAAFAELAARYPDDSLIAYHSVRLAAGETGSTIVMEDK